MKSIRFALIAATTALLSTTALAATSDTVTLGGTVVSTLSLVSTPTAGASALDLDGDGSAGEHIVKVSDLAISTNNEQGYLLTASSGNLTKAGGTSIAFQVHSVADGAAAPATGDFLVSSGSNYTVSTSSSGPVAKDLYIKYTPLALQDAGAYAGSISLTVSDN